MSHLFLSLSDKYLTDILYLQSSLAAIIGLYISIKPTKAIWERIVVSCFFLFLCGVGFVITMEQARRNQNQSSSLGQAQVNETLARNKEESTLNDVQNVLVTMSRNMDCVAVKTALDKINALSQKQASLVKQITIKESAASTQAPLIDRAIKMNRLLQGTQNDWNAQFDRMEKDIRNQWANPFYTQATEADRRTYIRSDERLIAWKQKQIDLAEVKFYRSNYEAQAQALRAELISVAPGAGDPEIDYGDPDLTLPGFVSIVEDFNALTKAYAASVAKY